MGGISENWRGHSLSNGVQSIHTEFQGNRTIFQDGGFGEGGISPPGGERGGISQNGQKLSSSKVLDNIQTKFKDNPTKFRDFGILGGKSPPGGEWGEFRKTENGIRKVMGYRAYIPNLKVI